MKCKSLMIILLVSVMLLPVLVQAEELTAREIIDKTNIMNLVDDMQAEMEMVMINKAGQKRVRELMSYSKKDKSDDIEKSIMRFLSPADVKGTGFLSIDNPQGADEKYLYLPAMRRPRRLSSDERGGSFMGSDFSYEDISESVEDYIYTIIGTEEIDGQQVYIVESIPRTKEIEKDVEFARKISWVRKDNFVLIKAEFHDKKDEVLKRLNVLEIKQITEEVWMPVHLEMETYQKGSRTSLKYKDIKVDTGLTDDYFSVRQLTRPL